MKQITLAAGAVLASVLVASAVSCSAGLTAFAKAAAVKKPTPDLAGLKPASPFAAAEPDAAATARVHDVYAKLPLSFEMNRGQTDPQVTFLSRGEGYTVFLTASEAVLSLREPDARRTTLRMQVVGANPRAEVTGRDQLPGKVNYLRGNNPTLWRTGIPTYAKVAYQGVYPGIDMVYYGHQRALEYDFIVAPGVDPGAIALTFEGAESVKLDGEGHLILQTGGSELTQRAPVVYQDIDGVRTTVAGRYALQAVGGDEPRSSIAVLGSERQVVRFVVGEYDRHRPLVIDPVLIYSTYLGGAGHDEGRGIAVDTAGNAYVTGSTDSINFPTTSGAFGTTFEGGGGDAFVTKVEANGAALAYSTYLGGSGTESGYAIAVDSAGSAYVTGNTTSSDFPTTPGAFDTTFGGSYDVFVTKLEANGAALAYSTYLGGSSGAAGFGIAVDSAESAYVVGHTMSSNFPTTPGAFDTTHAGSYDAFVTKLETSGAALAYSTFLGGDGSDVGLAIAVDSAFVAHVTGYTTSSGFPTIPGAFDTTLGGPYDAFVTKLEANGAALVYSTYLGGSSQDYGLGIAVAGDGGAHVTGYTDSSGDFPTTPGAFDTTFGGGAFDAFVTKLESDGAALVYSTYLGGVGSDTASAIALDGAGSAFVTGVTGSSNFPTTPGAFDTTLAGVQDAFVTTLEATGAALAYSTYLGGAGGEQGQGIAVDDVGSGYFTGWTASTDFATTPGAFDTTFGGVRDAFVVRIGDPPGPDLVETALSNPPAVLVLKQKFSVTDSVHNQGSAAVATTTRYYLSLDTVRNAGDKVQGGKRAVPALAAGATSTGPANVTVATTTKVGVYYLLACADDLNVQTETNESNNCRASTTPVEVRAPDMSETAVSNPPATAPRGTSFSVTDTVGNVGNAPAGASTTRYFLSLDTKKAGTDPLLTGVRAVPALGAAASSTGTVTATIPAATAPATYYLIACGDDLKKVPESNEKNNCRASATKVTVNP